MRKKVHPGGFALDGPGDRGRGPQDSGSYSVPAPAGG
jgi:hypothetical protein